MKAVLEFNLPEEADEHQFALNGINYAIVIDDLDNWLRGLIKYEDKQIVSTQEVRDKLRELLDQRDLK